MIVKIIIPIIVTCLATAGCAQEGKSQVKEEVLPSSNQKELAEAPQEMLSSFSVSGYAKGGKKQWDLEGKSADIMSEKINLQDVTAKVYGKDADITIVADEGSLNRIDNNVHLEKNVLVTTDDGATLTTDYLDWDAQNQKLTSAAPVQIKREMMEATGIGIKALPLLNLVELKKDVTVTLSLEQNKDNLVESEQQDQGPDSLTQTARPSPTVITCDGPLEVEYENNLAVFYDNVQVNDSRGEIFADKMDVYFATQTEEGKQLQGMQGLGIKKIVAAGNVEIHHGANTTYSQHAVYDTDTGKLTLTGQPKLVIYSTEEFSQLK